MFAREIRSQQEVKVYLTAIGSGVTGKITGFNEVKKLLILNHNLFMPIRMIWKIELASRHQMNSPGLPSNASGT